MDNPQKGNNTKGRNDNLNNSSTLPSNHQLSTGKALASFSDFVNNNLILFRYGTTATVVFLTAYGLSQTPIFFRFKRVADVPASYFAKRKTIHGRIVHVVDNDIISNVASSVGNEKPIICLIRHTSPFERILNRSSVEFFMRNNPSSHLKRDSRLEDAKDLLKVELAGVKEPPLHYEPHVEDTNSWLKRLAKARTPVACTLLSRRIINIPKSSNDKKYANAKDSTSQYTKIVHDFPIDTELEQAAICQLKYRPPKAIFRQDLGSSLIKNGRAKVSSGIQLDIPSMSTVDGSTKLGDMQSDVKYLENLVSLEMNAIKERKEIWSIEAIRNESSDLVDEAEFEMNAGILRKLWRRFTQ